MYVFTIKHPRWLVICKIDFANAFNTVRRDVILKNVQETLPEIYKMVWQQYSRESNLYFGDEHILKSGEGVQYSDPLGPLLFHLPF